MTQVIDPAVVAANVRAVRERIRGAGGDERVELVAVTKTFPPEAIVAAVAAGCRAIGENYAQELVAKVEALPSGTPSPVIHFIGHLQSNKVRLLAPVVDVWETVDRPSIVAELARRAPGATVFVQVNVDRDPAKGGCAVAEAPGLVELARQAGLEVEGLMTIGRQGPDAQVLAGFTTLRRLADSLGLRSCSMGMSADLELAVRAGATHVRVGSALFGERVHAHGDQGG